jgi:hypothetical protein
MRPLDYWIVQVTVPLQLPLVLRAREVAHTKPCSETATLRPWLPYGIWRAMPWTSDALPGPLKKRALSRTAPRALSTGVDGESTGADGATKTGAPVPTSGEWSPVPTSGEWMIAGTHQWGVTARRFLMSLRMRRGPCQSWCSIAGVERNSAAKGIG